MELTWTEVGAPGHLSFGAALRALDARRKDGRGLVVLAGSGLSGLAGIPDAAGATERLLGVARRAAPGWPQAVRDLPPPLRRTLVRRCLDEARSPDAPGTPRVEPVHEHRLLADFVLNGWVDLLWTTNFDHLLEDTCTDVHLPVASVEPLGWEPLRLQLQDRLPIVHLHGRDGLAGHDFLNADRRGQTHEMVRGATQSRDLLVLGWSGVSDPLVDLLPRALAPGARAFRIDLKNGVALQDWLRAMHELTVGDPEASQVGEHRARATDQVPTPQRPSASLSVQQSVVRHGDGESVDAIPERSTPVPGAETPALALVGSPGLALPPDAVPSPDVSPFDAVRSAPNVEPWSFARVSAFDDDSSDCAVFPSRPMEVESAPVETLSQCDERLASAPDDIEARRLRGRLRFEKALQTDDELDRRGWIERAEQDWAALPGDPEHALEEIEHRREWILYEDDPARVASSLDRCLALVRPLSIAEPGDVEIGLLRQRIAFERAHWIEEETERDRALVEALRTVERSESGIGGRELRRVVGHGHLLAEAARDASTVALQRRLLRAGAERLELGSRFATEDATPVEAAETWRSLAVLADDPVEQAEIVERASASASSIDVDSDPAAAEAQGSDPCLRPRQRLGQEFALLSTESWQDREASAKKLGRWAKSVAKDGDLEAWEALVTRARLSRIAASFQADPTLATEGLHEAWSCLEQLPAKRHGDLEVEEERARILMAFAWVLEDEAEGIVALRAAERSLHEVVKTWSGDAEIWYALATISGRRGQVVECVERIRNWLACRCCAGAPDRDRIRDDASFDPVRRAPEFVRALRVASDRCVQDRTVPA